MDRYGRIFSLLTVLGVLLGGCPVGPDSGLEATPEGGTPGGSSGGGGSAIFPGAGSSSTDSGTAGGSESLDDELREQFPTCLEPINGDDWRAEILRLVNVERTRTGLDPLTHDQTLEDQATQYACEMIHYDFFAHVNPVTGTELRDRAEDFGYDFLAIGENLAAGQSSPTQVMADWMGSAGHSENVLNPQFTELGVGVRTGGRYGTYWVQEFGRPMGASARPPAPGDELIIIQAP